MPSTVFGRTNQEFPPVWLSLCASPDEAKRTKLVDAAVAAGTVLDISKSPALWGGLMRGTLAKLMATGGGDIAVATSATHAADLIDAQLIQVLSCIGRPYIDFYFWEVRSNASADQIAGGLQALELARQEGHIKYLGIVGNAAGLKILQSHDAFDAGLIIEPEFVTLAEQRRLGTVSRQNQGAVQLVDVETAADVAGLFAVGGRR